MTKLIATAVALAALAIPAAASAKVSLGRRKTVDMPYTKLMGMNVFSDGTSFSHSNRQNAPLIKLTMNTGVVAALLNAAIQNSET